MMKTIIPVLLLLSLSWTIVYGQDANAIQTTLDQALTWVEVGELLESETFDSDAGYEPFEESFTRLYVKEGQYQMNMLEADAFSWESIQTNYTDVIIEADVSFEDEVGTDGSAGIICRTQSYDDPFGYFFEVSPSGDYIITRYADEEFAVIEEGTHDDAIGLSNHLLAVCVGDYLAFYSNGELLTELVDTTYDSGFTSWTASMYGGEMPILVKLDNVRVWSASEGAPDQKLPQVDLKQGDVVVTAGRHLLNEAFDRKDAWLPYSTEDTNFRIKAGVYRVEVRQPISSWASNGLLLTDSIVEVEIQQLSDYDINTMGVICRSTLDGSGYRFWIGGDGLYNIARWIGDERTDLIEDAQPIADMQDVNRLTAVCVDDYLALYVNGTLIAEARDTTHTSGVTAIVASVDGEDEIVEAEFDNLNIWVARSE